MASDLAGMGMVRLSGNAGKFSLARPMSSGDAVLIRGSAWMGGSINFMTAGIDDIALHWSLRRGPRGPVRGQGHIVRNTRHGTQWPLDGGASEEIAGEWPFQEGQIHDVTFRWTPSVWEITIDGTRQSQFDYRHRVQHSIDTVQLSNLGQAQVWLSSQTDLGNDADLQNDAMRFALSLGKVIAGLVRVVFEDMYNGVLQLIYLIKIWREPTTTRAMISFTIASIMGGMLASLLGPCLEYLNLRTLRGNASEDAYNDSTEPVQDELKADSDPLLADENMKDSRITSGANMVSPEQGGAQKAVERQKKPLQVADLTIRRFLLDQTIGDGLLAHRLLMTSSLMYWGSMAVIFFCCDTPCGKPPGKLPWLLFFGFSTATLIVEVWCLIHCRIGYLLFKRCHIKFFMGLIFGFLGRFDTFSDVVNTISIQNCVVENPEHYDWFSVKDRVFYLPSDLGTLMVVGLILVLVLQMFPGVVLLAWKRWLPIAFKFNEFCLVLVAMEEELKDDPAFDDPEGQ